MARHWSRFVGGVSEKQAYALDRMAQDAGMGDGMTLLMKITGCSSSKVGRMDARSLRHVIDQAFREYGKQR